MYDVAFGILIEAINAKTPCMITSSYSGVSMHSYQDKIGIHQILQLYMTNTADIDGVMGLRFLSAKDEREEGSLFIDWKKVRRVNINQDSGRYLVKIDHLEINFLKTIQ